MQFWLPFATILVAGLRPVLSVEASPDAMITAAPSIPSHLIQRQDNGPNVFGYISGNAGSPLGCGAGYKWSAQLAEYGFGACCNQVACTSQVHACVDGGIPNGCASEGCVGQFLTTISCDAPKPSCFRYILMSNAQDINPFYLLRCGTASEEIQVFAKATTGTNRGKTTQTTSGVGEISALGGGDPQDPNSGPTTNVNNPKATSTLSTSSNPDQATQPPEGSHNTRLYIIIGTIAGIFLIIASVIGGVCIYRRRNKRKNGLEAINLRDDITYLASDAATNYGGNGVKSSGKNSTTLAWLRGLSRAESSYGGNERGAPPSYGSPRFHEGDGYAQVNR